MLSHHPPRKPFISRKGLSISLCIVALLIACVTVLVTIAHRTPAIVRSGFSVTYTDQNGIIGRDQYKLFPSPTGAAEMLEEMLNDSREYREYSPCFDDRGRRNGERTALWL